MASENKIDLDIYRLIVEKLTDAADLATTGSQVIRLIVGGMDIKAATIFALNPVSEELEILATEGLSMNYVKKGPILVDNSIEMVSNKEPVLISDTASSVRLQYPEKAREEGIRAIVSLPVTIKGRTVGALRLYHSEVWEVSGQDLIYLEMVAKMIGLMLKCYRLSATVLSVKEQVNEIHSVWL